MKPSPATGRPNLEILGRPEGGLGETGPPVVSPSVSPNAKRDIVATIHRLIETLTCLPDELQRDSSMDPAGNLPLLLNAVETGKLLSISRAKVLELAGRGQLPSIRVGGSVRIPRDLLLGWIADNSYQARVVLPGPRNRWSDAERTV